MDTRWKRWTARTGVKAVSLVLVLALTGAIAVIALRFAVWGTALQSQYWERGYNVYLGMNVEQQLYNDAQSALYYVGRLAYFKDADSIRAGEYVRLSPTEEEEMVTTRSETHTLRTNGLPFGEWDEEIILFYDDFSDRAELDVQKSLELQRVIHSLRAQYPDEFYYLGAEERQRFLDGKHFFWDWGSAGKVVTTTVYRYSVSSLYPYYEEYYEMQSATPLSGDSPELAALARQVIAGQLREYRESADWLEAHGVTWYADVWQSDGTLEQRGDNALRGEDILSAYENCAVYRDNSIQIKPHFVWPSYYRYSNLEEYWMFETIALAFAPEYAETLRGFTREMTDEALSLGVGAVLGLLLLLIFALVLAASGTGRRIGPDGAVVYPEARKLWLDVLLPIAVTPSVFIVYGTVYSIAQALQTTSGARSLIGEGYLPLLYALTVLAGALAALPVTLWLLALCRRVKAGAWWRHTLIGDCFRGFTRLLGALPLALQALGVMAALIFEVVIVIVSYSGSEPGISFLFLMFFLVIDFAFLAMIVIQLRAVEQGAAAAARGENVSLPPMFGAFGRTGRSLSDLSARINTAVAERMKSERMKTELITNVSHDLRTPLTGLIAYVDLLQTEGLHSEKAPEYVEVLAQKAGRLKTLTDDLFEASKAVSGNVHAQIETLDLSALARQVLGELDEHIQKSGLDLRVTLPEHCAARGDGRLMWRVMENLLDNAMKYALPRSRVYLELEERYTTVSLTLKNISEHPLAKDPWELTERFTRGDESRAGEGSGLGLSIVKSFMDAQGGRLELTADGDLFKASVVLAKG